MDKIRKFYNHFIRNKKGATAVEFALFAPFIMVMFLGVYDFGDVMYQKAQLSSAVRIGAQYATSNRGDTSGIEAAVVGATNLNEDKFTITSLEFSECESGATINIEDLETIDRSEICDAGLPRTFVSISASMPHHLLFDYPGLNQDINIEAEAILRVE